ncbi:glycoside hydrolase family 76 protein [Sulfobacillus thermosulfidooxidans]|uniref:glycoside hydrolase family 76 protein n=1 Tax=Sulfobacillus thermosulfidooxidans TaxID=28034 RepID=UPI0002ED70FF|nr:glycoside hydrolase family 76 protein [Sulfobacillus thermosulfidooxidans]
MMSKPWDDPHNVGQAWHRCFHSFFNHRSKDFFEVLLPGRQKARTAFNWSFGALFSAYAACLGIPALKPELLQDLPTLKNALYGYKTNRHQGFLSATGKGQGQGDIYYDDNAWLALAALEIFRQTEEEFWLDMAYHIYQFIIQDGFEPKTGGVFWRESPRSSLHVCSTGPTLLLGVQLKQFGCSIADPDLTKMLAWCWHMRNDHGLFQDHEEFQTGRIDKAIYTYNTGTPLHALATMNEIMPTPLYQDKVFDIVKSLPYLLHDKILPPTPWFNVVLLRALVYVQTQHVGDVSQFIDAYRQAMIDAWKRFENTSEPLVLPSSENSSGILLRDAAASVETLAWLYRLEHVSVKGSG